MYKTSDLGLAAALSALGYFPEAVRDGSSSRFFFQWKEDEITLEEFARRYHQNNLAVDAKKMTHAMRDIKAIIYE